MTLTGFSVLHSVRAETEQFLAESARSPNTESQLVYILPIRGPIEPALLYVIRRGLAEAQSHQAQAIIFPMDTPGGAVDVTEKIVDLIARMPMPTYTFVEANAISAGAIIALSTDHIYMREGSKIGDAMPIMMSQTGGVQPLPEEVQEKMMSYVDSLVRGIAQRKGRDEMLASAMVRPEVEYIVDGEVISKEGQLLTLTNTEAERRYGEEQKPLLSEGTMDTFDGFLEAIGFADATRVELEITNAERIARFLQMLGPILMMLGFLGLYLEFQSPGFGLPGILGIVCLLLFFLGHHIAGLAGQEDMLIFLLGVTLVLIEVFVIPGFGVVGLTGLFLIFWGLLNAMVQRFPGDPWIPSLPTLQVPLLNLSISIVGAAVGAAVLGKFIPRTSMFQRMVLSTATSRDEGYNASTPLPNLLGSQGVSVSPLTPGGAMMMDDERRLDVVTRGEYIAEGVRVQIVEVHGNRLVVEPVGDI